MCEKQNQHYVPKYYFRNFNLNTEYIYMLIKKKGKIIDRPVSIKKQASENLFYGPSKVEDWNTDNDTLHASNLKSILSLNDINKITNKQLNILLENIVFQYERTLSMRIQEQPKLDYYKEFYDNQKKLIKKEKKENIPDEINDIINNIICNTLDSLSNEKINQQINLKNIELKKEDLSDLKFKFLINKTNLPFIFSDNPVVFTNIALQDYDCSKISYNSLGLVIIYPLSSTHMCLLYDSETYQMVNDSNYSINIESEQDICSLNKLQIHNAFNSIYFADIEIKEYIKQLWQEEKANFSYAEPKIICVQDMTLDGVKLETKSYILDIPEPAYYPQLSFLKVSTHIEVNNIFRSKFIKYLSIQYSEDDLMNKVNLTIDKK